MTSSSRSPTASTSAPSSRSALDPSEAPSSDDARTPTRWKLSGSSDLPPVKQIKVTLVSSVPARLPPLVTTSLHGALEDALPEVCNPALPQQLELIDGASHPEARGASQGAPRPWLVTPLEPVTGLPRVLEPGEPLLLGLTLIGANALRHESLMMLVLQRAGERGIGLSAGAGRTSSRPAFKIAHAEPLCWPDDASASTLRAREDHSAHAEGPAREEHRGLVLELTTPAILKHHGRPASTIDETILWRALVRRTNMLGLCYGSGAVVDRAPPAPFVVEQPILTSLPTKRWSSRHKTRMIWDGLVGSLVVRPSPSAPPEDTAAFNLLLRFGEQVHLGASTGFGFGRYTLRPR